MRLRALMSLILGLAALVTPAAAQTSLRHDQEPLIGSDSARDISQHRPQLVQYDPRYIPDPEEFPRQRIYREQPQYYRDQPQYYRPAPQYRPAPRYVDPDEDYVPAPRRAPRAAGLGRACVTSRGVCFVNYPQPVNSGCRCEVPGFGLKRGAIGY